LLDAINIAITRIREAVTSKLRRQDGQTLVEYALIIALIAVGLIIALIFLRDEIEELFSDVGNELDKAPSP
jgi:pilus assembly protein Flp/PilA